MTEWWTALPIDLKFYYGVGIISLLVVMLQLLLTLVGIGGDAFDGSFDVDVGDIDHGSGIGMFSIQTLTTFFVAFGWAGVVASKFGVSVYLVALIAFLSGVAAMYVMYRTLKALLTLQGKGNLDYRNAIGEEGSVYVTIPPNQADGGQIQVTIQGRLTTAAARTSEADSIKPGQRVKIVSVVGPTSFEVESV